MRGSRLSAFLMLVAFVAAFVISAPALVAEHAWDADDTGTGTRVATSSTGSQGTATPPDSVSTSNPNGVAPTTSSTSDSSILSQLLLQLSFLVTGGGL